MSYPARAEGLVNSTFVGYLDAKAILLEEQLWYYLTHSWEDKWAHSFPKAICPKVNVIAWLEFELAFYDSVVHPFNHYTTRTPQYQQGSGWTWEYEVMKWYSTLISQEVESCHLMEFNVLPKILLFAGSLTDCRWYNQSILRSDDWGNTLDNQWRMDLLKWCTNNSVITYSYLISFKQIYLSHR